MSNEYYAVILEFTSREVKLGFVGESSAHITVTHESRLWKQLVPSHESKHTSPAFLQIDSHAIPANLKEDILDGLRSSKISRDSFRAFERDRISSKWCEWSFDEYTTLSLMVKHLLLGNLLVSPSKTKLFVVESGMCATSKAVFCKTFLASKSVVSVAFLPLFLCCCIGAGVENALVVYLDWATCKVVPVADLRSLPSKEFVQFSGESVHYSPAIHHGDRTFEDVEKEILTCNKTMELALFSRNGLPAAIAKFVKKLDVDLRAPVMANVIFAGSRSEVPGVKGRALTELASHLPGYEVSGKICLGAWAGASIYCSTTLLKEKSSNWKHKEISRLNLTRAGTPIFEEYHT